MTSLEFISGHSAWVRHDVKITLFGSIGLVVVGRGSDMMLRLPYLVSAVVVCDNVSSQFISRLTTELHSQEITTSHGAWVPLVHCFVKYILQTSPKTCVKLGEYT